ncbi:MAG: hypothetical protein AB7E55_03195 [Pigmentiphaga sp.]
MDPVTAMVIGSTAMQAAGSIMQGNAQAAAYDQQAQAADRNARMADLQARQALDAGTQNELSQRRSAGQQQAQVRAAVAESGFDPGSGSALAIQVQSARDLEMDALQTRYESLLQGYGHEQQGVMDRYTARTLRQSGRRAQEAGWIGAATSALTGAAKAYGPGGTSGGGGSALASRGGPVTLLGIRR